MIMQSKSIYHPSYKPLFINEIDKDDVKDFSTNLSNKLRQIKLAISKANINKKPLKNNDSNKAISNVLNLKTMNNQKIRNLKILK